MYKKDFSITNTLQNNLDLYDSYYQKPDWWFRFRYDTQVKRKTCLYLLKQAGVSLSNQRVLEIGFGSGEVLFSFDCSCEIYGLEISHSAVVHVEQKAARLGYKEAEFRISTGEILSYPDNYFDIIIASHVIEHVADDHRLLQEIWRTLKKDGVAVLLIPINETYHDPNHVHRYTSEDFLELTQKNLFFPALHIENELLFHFVEKFYFEEYSKRWKTWGPIIAALFNFPTSILPFRAYQFIDRVMITLGWKPRQLGSVLAKSENDFKMGL